MCFVSPLMIAHRANPETSTGTPITLTLPNPRREAAETLRGAICRRDTELETSRIALNAMDKLVLVMRNRSFRLGAASLDKLFRKVRRKQLLRSFMCWVNAPTLCATSPSGKEWSTPISAATGQVVSPAQLALSGSCPGDEGRREARETALDLHEQVPEDACEVEDGCGTETNAERAAHGTGSTFVEGQGGPWQADNESFCRLSMEADHPCNGTSISKPPVATRTAIVQTSPLERPETADTDAPTLGRGNNPWLDASPDVTGRVCSIRSTTTPDNGGADIPSAAESLRSCMDAALPARVDEAAGSTDGTRQQFSPPVPSNIRMDLPRLVLSLRTAVGRELYTSGERLFRCVEADHGESYVGSYDPVAPTSAERTQFRACLEDTCNGPLRQGILALLRVQETSRNIALGRGDEPVELPLGRSDGERGNGATKYTRTTETLPMVPLPSKAQKCTATR